MDSSDLAFHFITPAHPLYAKECQLRWERLRRPLGHPLGTEKFDFEDSACHLVATDGNGECVGCVLFIEQGERTGRLFQMAVSAHVEGHGLGRALVRTLERHLRAQGIEHVFLHARCHVQGFYERLGYVPCSDVYEEVGIPHISMERRLRPESA